MRKFLIVLVLVGMVTATFTLTAAGQVTNESYTGCLTSGGDLTNIGMGDFPARPCNRNQTQITLIGPGTIAELFGDLADEANARMEADEALEELISDEEAARTAADSQLAADLAAEEAARMAADAGLESLIDTEEAARTVADEGLSASVLALESRVEALESLLEGVERELYFVSGSPPGPYTQIESLYFPGAVIADGLRSYGCIVANGNPESKTWCQSDSWNALYGSGFVDMTP